MAGSAPTFASELSPSLESLLGGRGILRAKPRSSLDWIELVRNGFPAVAVQSLAKALLVSQSEIGAALGIPERTLARRRREGVLNAEESAKLLRLARVAAKASQVFEGFDAALDWLKSPNAALGGGTPLGLLDTDIGAESVLDTLGRIEHGVFG